MHPLFRVLRSLHAAAAFLTVLAPATPHEVDPSRSLPAFPFVGLSLGGLLYLPFALGLLDGRTWLQAWSFLTLCVLATRGLHWDGWADLWDGLGSGATGERFWQVIKDSHTGAFGVLAMLLAASGQLLCFQVMFEKQAWGALVFTVALGRCAIPVLAWLARKQTRPPGGDAGLGLTFLRQASLQGLAASGVALLFCLLLVSWQSLFLAVILMGAFLWLLARIGHRNGGLNGDFFGAAVIAAELCACLGFVLAA